VFFGFNRGVLPVYAARRFDELSRGFVSCLFNSSFEKRFRNATTLFCIPKSMRTMVSAGAIRGKYSPDGGVRRPVASRVALDLPDWAMRSALYRLIRMAIEMASESAAFFSVVDNLSCITVAK
jgi:hypothetical protein